MNIEMEKKAIFRLQQFEPCTEPYYLAYSGGKDSDVLLALAKLSGVKYEAVHNLTTVDAPETVYHVKSHKDVRIDKSYDLDGNHINMERLIVSKFMPPTRKVRYCCEVLKERGGERRKVLTGVRRCESQKRFNNSGLVNISSKPKKAIKSLSNVGIDFYVNRSGGIVMDVDNDLSREWLEDCYRSHKTMINPIVDWSDSDIWEFLSYYNIELNPLYDSGFCRVGCIGCPLASKNDRLLEFQRYPKFKDRYIHAFDSMLSARLDHGLYTSWKSGEEVFYWWLEEDYNQLSFDGFSLI